MAQITAQLVKDLREKTGAGMMDCKKALGETDGEMEAAVDWLRKKGLSAAAKKSGRVAADGLIGVVVEGSAGAILAPETSPFKTSSKQQRSWRLVLRAMWKN